MSDDYTAVMADLERCCECDAATGRAGRSDGSRYCDRCDAGPLCDDCDRGADGILCPRCYEREWNAREVEVSRG